MMEIYKVPGKSLRCDMISNVRSGVLDCKKQR